MRATSEAVLWSGILRAGQEPLDLCPRPQPDDLLTLCTLSQYLYDLRPRPPFVTPHPNGIQLGSKCGLYQGLAQQTSWFAHKREGFGPPLFDPGLDTVGPCGIEE